MDAFKVVTKTRNFGGTRIHGADVDLVKEDFFRSLKNLKSDSVYAESFMTIRILRTN